MICSFTIRLKIKRTRAYKSLRMNADRVTDTNTQKCRPVLEHRETGKIKMEEIRGKKRAKVGRNTNCVPFSSRLTRQKSKDVSFQTRHIDDSWACVGLSIQNLSCFCVFFYFIIFFVVVVVLFLLLSLFSFLFLWRLCRRPFLVVRLSKTQSNRITTASNHTSLTCSTKRVYVIEKTRFRFQILHTDDGLVEKAGADKER